MSHFFLANMGRQSEPIIINHFSHQHPLHLTNPQPSTTCSACKQTIETEPFYTCISPPCTTFSLHLKCSKLPQRITHPCHHNHPLSLLPKSHNPNGGFAWNACGNHGDGFSYTCKECGVSIHVVCATLPLCLYHLSHGHRLGLVFGSPYETGGFSCDVCGVIEGGKCWLYRCGSCGFDAHLSCATSKAQAVVSRAGSSTNREMLFLNQINNQRNQNLQAMMIRYGGGVNANNQLLQTLMGGNSNMNNQMLQAIMGGGGGGSNQLLQALMGGGGGGGDLIQSLLNGSNGGLGGLDLSSVGGNVGDFGGFMGAGFGGFGL